MFFSQYIQICSKKIGEVGYQNNSNFFLRSGVFSQICKNKFWRSGNFFFWRSGVLYSGVQKTKKKNGEVRYRSPYSSLTLLLARVFFFCKAAVASLAFFRLCLTISLLVLGDAVRLLWFDPLRVEADILCSVLHFHRSWTWPCPFYLKRTEHVFSFTS